MKTPRAVLLGAVCVLACARAVAATPESISSAVERFARMLWVSQGRLLPGLEGAAAPPLAASFAKQHEKFRHIDGANPRD